MPYQLHRTRDIYLSAYLILQGYEVSNKEIDHKGVVNFSFVADRSFKTHCDVFYNRTAQVEPSEYANIVRGLKTDIYELKRSNYVKEKKYK